ncbi:hypothetical protein SAMN04488589_1877 [Methanolobus vulcani]|jgi:hypothetical protein|uniref:Uncharacterized protein n=1 Tax=Methanolobus vulcani TaxID=38026 RepID=A0A7Z7AZN2_9EURY|nr:hypothetical protein [Methanolobus vulcani]MDK2825690.1 hypothetical protein [Methanolobus sp.]SDF97260.1 hypothetical protein SAMN04488589_1877 [Methanolobus vulcani]
MNQKYAAIFLALLMVMSVFSYFVVSLMGNSNDSTANITDTQNAPGFEVISGTHFGANMNSISDGLAFSPEGVSTAVYVDYSRTYGTPLQDYNVSDLYYFYNTLVYKSFFAYNSTSGFRFQAHLMNPEVIKFNYSVAGTYNGYSLLSRPSLGLYNIIGTPTLLGGMNSLEKVIDVKSGNAPASSDFTEILSYADMDAEYQAVTSTDPLAEQHYLDFKNMGDGNYSKTELFLNPLDTTLDTITSFKNNGSERNMMYNVDIVDDGRIAKVVVTTNASNFYNLSMEQYY